MATKTEIGALRLLGSRGTWMLHELPEAIGESMLRRLDGLGWIEVRVWTPRQVRREPSGVQETVVSPSLGWLSPRQKPDLIGRWDVICRKYRRGGPHDSKAEIRVSEAGRDALDRMEEEPAEPVTAPITIAVAVERFQVSRGTLLRLVRQGTLRDFRPKEAARNAPVLLDAAELATRFPQWESRG